MKRDRVTNLWVATFTSMDYTHEIWIAAKTWEVMDVVKRTPQWKIERYTLQKIEKKPNLVHIAPFVESPQVENTPEQTCITWTASWLPWNP